MAHAGGKTGPRSTGALGLVLLLAAIFIAPRPATTAEAEDLFTVSGIAVDATARSAALARDVALAEGQRRALEQLWRRLVLRTDLERVPDLEPDLIPPLVGSISVENERTSSVRYLAKLTVNFKKEAIRNLLADYGISYAETRSKVRLVIPVYEAAGALLLWDDPNPWRSAWEARGVDSGGPVPLMLPNADRADMAILSALHAAEGDEQRLVEFAARYEISDILIAMGRLEFDLAANRPRVHVTLREIGPAGEGVILQSFDGIARDRVPELLAEAVAESVQRLEDRWKRENLLRFDNPVRLSARVPISGLEEWLEVRQRLAESAVVRGIELAALTRSDAQVLLHYLGDPSQLILDLAQRDLDLVEIDGFWTLTLRQPVAGGDGDR